MSKIYVGGMLAAVLLASATTGPARAGSAAPPPPAFHDTRELVFDFDEPLLNAELGLTLSFPAALGVCDSLGLLGGSPPDCETDGPLAALLSPDVPAFASFDILLAQWSLAGELSLGAVFNAVLRLDGGDAPLFLPTAGVLAFGPFQGFEGVGPELELEDEACFLPGTTVFEDDDAQRVLHVCQFGGERFFADLSSPPLAAAAPEPAALTLFGLGALLLAARRRR